MLPEQWKQLEILCRRALTEVPEEHEIAEALKLTGAFAKAVQVNEFVMDHDQALQTHDIVDYGDDGAMVFTWTNDDRDLGVPSEIASWSRKFESAEQALQYTGKSRRGVSGVKVVVTLDGKEVE